VEVIEGLSGWWRRGIRWSAVLVLVLVLVLALVDLKVLGSRGWRDRRVLVGRRRGQARLEKGGGFGVFLDQVRREDGLGVEIEMSAF
jgi:hypothetical protein